MTKVIVYHGGYGCDTGCCGHWVQIGDTTQSKFGFDHPHSMSEDDVRKFVRDFVTEKLGAEHVADIDWENCEIVDD